MVYVDVVVVCASLMNGKIFEPPVTPQTALTREAPVSDSTVTIPKKFD